jgi:hypothetical protein
MASGPSSPQMMTGAEHNQVGHIGGCSLAHHRLIADVIQRVAAIAIQGGSTEEWGNAGPVAGEHRSSDFGRHGISARLATDRRATEGHTVHVRSPSRAIHAPQT